MAAAVPPLPNMANPANWLQVLKDHRLPDEMADFVVSDTGGGATDPMVLAQLNSNYSKGKDLTALLSDPPRTKHAIENPRDSQRPFYYDEVTWRLTPILKYKIENLVVLCSFYEHVGWESCHITRDMLTPELAKLVRTQCDGMYNTFSTGRKSAFPTIGKNEAARTFLEKFQAKAQTVPGASWHILLGMYMREDRTPRRLPVLPGKAWSAGSDSVADELIRFGQLDNPHAHEDRKILFQYLSDALKSVPTLSSELTTFQKKNDFDGAIEQIKKSHLSEEDYRATYDEAEKLFLHGKWDPSKDIKKFSKSFNDSIVEMRDCAKKLKDKQVPNADAIRRQYLDSVGNATDQMMISTIANFKTINNTSNLDEIQSTLANLDPNKAKKTITNHRASVAAASGVTFDGEDSDKKKPAEVLPPVTLVRYPKKFIQSLPAKDRDILSKAIKASGKSVFSLPYFATKPKAIAYYKSMGGNEAAIAQGGGGGGGGGGNRNGKRGNQGGGNSEQKKSKYAKLAAAHAAEKKKTATLEQQIEGLTGAVESMAQKLESNASASLSSAKAKTSGEDSQGSDDTSILAKLKAVRDLKKKEAS